MRLNFSHATYEEANLRVKNIKLCPSIRQKNQTVDCNLRAIMLDTQGPEIRTGSFADGVKEITLTSDNLVTLTTDESFRNKQSHDKIWISYLKLPSTVSPGETVLLDDGAIELKVLSQENEVETLCRVVNTGILGNKKGVNLPGIAVDLPAMCDKDKVDIRWGIENDIDYIAASFTRKASDIVEIREYVSGLMKEFNYPADYPHPKIIAKIENIEALDNFESILEETDAIMVARGDLGVEIPMETLTNIQKQMVRKCNLAGKPVIVATQMLESMQKNPRPTRAECTDVTNAIYDGADCVMLSGESAKGKYPLQSIHMMQNIILQAERFNDVNVYGEDTANASRGNMVKVLPKGGSSFEGMGAAIVEASKSLNATCIIVLSKSGIAAANVAKFRPSVPIVCIVPDQKTGRMLQIYRGIHPVVTPPCQPSHLGSDPRRYDEAVHTALALGFCKQHDNVIVVAAEKSGSGLSTALAMRVLTVL